MNPISAFLKSVLDMIYMAIGNYGWSVVAFTLLIRLVLLPLDIKSKQSMARMQSFQPQIDALNKKYAKDKDKLNQKMSELYKKEKINPASGCLPMLIQMPILFCMFTAMRVVANEETVRMIQNMMEGKEVVFQSWLWIKNVFQPDSFMSTVIPMIGDQLQAIAAVPGTILTEDNLRIVREFLASDAYKTIATQYGADSFLYQAPLLMWTIQIPQQFNGLFILPLLAGASQFLTSKFLNPTQSTQTTQSSAQSQQNQMMQWFFPLFSIFICATSTGAFSIYWVAINIIQIVQQLALNWWFKKKGTLKPEEVGEA